jgi:hypothetical protein
VRDSHTIEACAPDPYELDQVAAANGPLTAATPRASIRTSDVTRLLILELTAES